MECRECGYRLWNLKARICPECGVPFAPSEFEFALNSVAFCCPHCDQDYYGTDDKGHLVPHTFDCVKCGTAITMDEMVLRPTAGVAERDTKAAITPWLDRKEVGRIRAWFQMIGFALFSPSQAMQGLGSHSSVGQAWWFAYVTLLAGWLIGLAPFFICAFSILFRAAANPGMGAGGPPGVFLGIGLASGVAFALIGYAIMIALWGLIAHGIIRFTGGSDVRIGGTYEAICYSSGTLGLLAIPCLGYFIRPVAAIWWIVSAIFMVKERHRISGGRASLAVLTGPGLAILATIGLFALIFALETSGAAWMPPTTVYSTPTVTARSAVTSLEQYAFDNGGAWPPHASQMLVTGDSWTAAFILEDSLTLEEAVPIGSITLEEADVLSWSRSAKLQSEVQAAVTALPAGTIAHRLGDVVFCYHGIDRATADKRLWIVVTSPDPVVNSGQSLSSISPGGTVVGMLDGTTQVIRHNDLAAELVEQNKLRAQAGLAPLPDPAQVTHEQPAVDER